MIYYIRGGANDLFFLFFRDFVIVSSPALLLPGGANDPSQASRGHERKKKLLTFGEIDGFFSVPNY